MSANKLRDDFGAHLKELRKVKNLSQEQLAEKADLHPTFIGAVERGTKSPTLDSIGKIAHALQISIKDLFAFSSSKKDKVKDEINSYLDKDRHNRNKSECSCGISTLIGTRDIEGEKSWTHLRIYCKKWVCPTCGPKKAIKLKKAIIKQASEKNLRRLLTLTLDPSKCKAEESVPYIKNCWNKMRTYLKRKFGNNITFIGVLELQKSGYAHLHVLIDWYIEQEWISNAWSSIGGGKIVHVKYVDIHRVTHYLSKYLTKSMFLKHYGKNRRYTTSRDLSLKEKKTKQSNTVWRVLCFPIESLLYLAGFEAFNEETDYDKNLRSFETNFSMIKAFRNLDDFLLL